MEPIPLMWCMCNNDFEANKQIVICCNETCSIHTYACASVAGTEGRPRQTAILIASEVTVSSCLLESWTPLAHFLAWGTSYCSAGRGSRPQSAVSTTWTIYWASSLGRAASPSMPWGVPDHSVGTCDNIKKQLWKLFFFFLHAKRNVPSHLVLVKTVLGTFQVHKWTRIWYLADWPFFRVTLRNSRLRYVLIYSNRPALEN